MKKETKFALVKFEVAKLKNMKKIIGGGGNNTDPTNSGVDETILTTTGGGGTSLDKQGSATCLV